MGDHQRRPSTVNLCPFVGVDLNLLPTVYIAIIMLTQKKNELNQIFPKPTVRRTIMKPTHGVTEYFAGCSGRLHTKFSLLAWRGLNAPPATSSH